MSRRTYRAFTFPILVFALLAPPNLRAAEPPAAARPDNRPTGSPADGGIGQNAALRYWIAFAQLPTLDAAQQKIVGDWQTTPLNADSRKAIQSADASLRYLHYGAAMPRCNWGSPMEEGFSLLLPHLSKGRQLARLALLRARDRFENSDPTGAVDDVADAFTLGRHLAGEEGVLIATLVRYSVEDWAIEAAAPHLSGLKPEVLDRLAGRLDRLPPGPSLGDYARVEQAFGQRWLIGHIRDEAAKGKWEAFVISSFDIPAEGGVPPAYDGRSLIRASGGTAEGVIAQLEKLDVFYDGVAALLDLPPDQFRPKYAELTAKVKDNPFASLLLPNFEAVYNKAARYRTRVALFRAAVAIARGGPDKAKDFPDPFGEGAPFAYRQLPGGFELRSKLTQSPGPDRQPEPVTLTVGAGH
jgi:hypothetical protein